MRVRIVAPDGRKLVSFNRWLDVDEDDGLLERELPLTGVVSEEPEASPPKGQCLVCVFSLTLSFHVVKSLGIECRKWWSVKGLWVVLQLCRTYDRAVVPVKTVDRHGQKEWNGFLADLQKECRRRRTLV